MKQICSSLFFLAPLAALLAGCGDPADKVHKSQAADPKTPTSGPSVAGKEYVIRTESSKVGFTGSKVTGSHTGGFKKFAGSFKIADNKLVGTPELKIDMNSTFSDNERLTGHLKNKDFFEVEKYPLTTFTVTSADVVDTNKYTVTGNLDLHGVKKSISFPAEIKVSDDEVTLKSQFAINRRDFNINYAGKADDLIRDQVVLSLDVKATPGPPAPADQLAQ
jgi:polyisoprenoid-binding protein YceI